MEHFKYYFDIYKKQILYCVVFVILIILASLSFFVINNRYNQAEIIKDGSNLSSFIENNEDPNESENEKTIKVDIKGCVNNPGVYEIEDGKRVIDLIILAGGLKENAFTKSINLSQSLNDEDVIVIYSINEIKNVDNQTLMNTNNNIFSSNESTVITKKQQSLTDYDKNNSLDSDSSVNTVVNINTATKETLMTLNGIGESKAIKIIEYRNINGNFKSVEELKNVNGIGEAIYAKIKDNITV